MQGKQYKHRNGNIYTVLFLTNVDSEDKVNHPIDVVYIGQDGKLWSSMLSDWYRSFTEITFDEFGESYLKIKKET
jgi:hypothetical protein